jgi:hypothetical protein
MPLPSSVEVNVFAIYALFAVNSSPAPRRPGFQSEPQAKMVHFGTKNHFLSNSPLHPQPLTNCRLKRPYHFEIVQSVSNLRAPPSVCRTIILSSLPGTPRQAAQPIAAVKPN